MKSENNLARVAGFLYVLLILSGFFYLKYVPSKLIKWDNPAATVKNITDSELLFRSGILVGLIGYLIFLILPLVLYKLLSPINKTYAILMVAFATISVPLSFANMLNNFNVLELISGSNYLKTVDALQLQYMVMLNLNNYDSGNLIASIFWGLWLFPLGYLVFKSGFLPKIIGVILMIGCFGYLINFTGRMLFPAPYHKLGIASFISIPASIGELSICLWLLIAGVRDKKNTSSLSY